MIIRVYQSYCHESVHLTSRFKTQCLRVANNLWYFFFVYPSAKATYFCLQGRKSIKIFCFQQKVLMITIWTSNESWCPSSCSGQAALHPKPHRPIVWVVWQYYHYLGWWFQNWSWCPQTLDENLLYRNWVWRIFRNISKNPGRYCSTSCISTSPMLVRKSLSLRIMSVVHKCFPDKHSWVCWFLFAGWSYSFSFKPGWIGAFTSVHEFLTGGGDTFVIFIEINRWFFSSFYGFALSVPSVPLNYCPIVKKIMLNSQNKN